MTTGLELSVLCMHQWRDTKTHGCDRDLLHIGDHHCTCGATRSKISTARCDRHVGEPYASRCADCDQAAREA